jgi:transcriptional regulatory protein GAL4
MAIWVRHSSAYSTIANPLGFASGASLLRILQICAGGLSLSRISTPHPSPRMGPVPLFAWDGSEPSESDMNMYLDVYFEQYHPQYPLG